MNLKDSLINRIINIKRKVGFLPLDPTYLAKSKANDLFELFVFKLILEAALQEGSSPIRFVSIHGDSSSNLKFRTSPGYINRGSYTYAIIGFPGNNPPPVLEVHIGVYAAGKSGVMHECDVAVVLQEEANKCRNLPKKALIQSSKIILAVECKCYENSDINISQARAFMGLPLDYSEVGKQNFVFNKEQKTIEKLLSHYKKEWEHNISPTSKIETLRLINSFQNVFKYFKAKY